MADYGIPLDKAELLSVFLEAVLYGFSLLMFGGTIWTLFSQRTACQVNRKMLTVACALLICSTTHLVLHMIRVVDGLILYRDTYPGGPAAYFSDVSNRIFVAKNYVYITQTLIGDGVVLYRCRAVWESNLVMIFPVVLWFCVGVTGFGSVYVGSKSIQNGVFGGKLHRWISSFWAMTLTTNLLATGMLACRIWYVDRKTSRLCGRRKSQLRPLLHIVVDAGMIYSITIVVAMICFEVQSNGQYVVLDMVMPIISITFYMVIIRIGIAKRALLSQPLSMPTGCVTPANSRANRSERRRTEMCESSSAAKDDDDDDGDGNGDNGRTPSSSSFLTNSVEISQETRLEITSDGEGE